MKILDIRETTVSLASSMRNAEIGFDAMTASAVAIVTDRVRDGRAVVGLGFDSIGRYGHGGLLRERFIPRLLAANPEDYADEASDNLDPFKLQALLMCNEKPGGHGERAGAVGLLDAAAWDLVAKLEDKPLWRVLAERFNNANADRWVEVYASGGHYHSSGGPDSIADEIKGYRDAGFRRVKIKIGGVPLADDLARIEAALGVLGDGDDLAVDANAIFDRDTAFAYAEALAPYRLAWIEEPVAPLDFALHAELAGRYGPPIATGENLFSTADLRNLLRHGGLRPDRDLLQMDISLGYGIVEYLRMLELAGESGWSRRRFLPHAGHLLSLAAAAGLGLGGHEAAPDPDQLFGGFAAGVLVADGLVAPGEAPGVGIEAKDNLNAVFSELLA